MFICNSFHEGGGVVGSGIEIGVSTEPMIDI